MLKHRLKLSEHAHSGKIRQHEHTSYLPLAAILVIVGFLLTTFSVGAADMTWVRPGPAAGSVGLVGAVPGKPPTSGAVIISPVSGQRFSQTPITIRGTCPVDTAVEIFKNDIFAGSTVCTKENTFSLESDLLIGQNVLVARVYDALNQPGPDSNAVTVFYDGVFAQASGLSSLDFGGAQMLINTDAVFRGSFPGKELTIPVEIIGGRAPYAVNIQWGDSTNTVVSRPDNSPFRTPHTYNKAGTFQLAIQATDADGRVAFLTVASIVNGQPDAAATQAEKTRTTTNLLLVLWPLYVSIFVAVISFWIGQWREKRLLLKHGYVQTSAL